MFTSRRSFASDYPKSIFDRNGSRHSHKATLPGFLLVGRPLFMAGHFLSNNVAPLLHSESGARRFSSPLRGWGAGVPNGAFVVSRSVSRALSYSFTCVP